MNTITRSTGQIQCSNDQAGHEGGDSRVGGSWGGDSWCNDSRPTVTTLGLVIVWVVTVRVVTVGVVAQGRTKPFMACGWVLGKIWHAEPHPKNGMQRIFYLPTPLLNTKLIRFGPLFHENPVFSFIFASVKFLAQNYLFAPLFVLEKVGHFGGYPVEHPVV